MYFRKNVCARTALAGIIFMAGVLLAWPPAARAEGDRVETKGPKIASVTVTATPQNFKNGIGGGAFQGIRATSTDSEATPDIDTDLLPPPGPLTYIAGTSYATKQTRATGIKFDAQSKITVKATKVTKTQVSWSATAAAYGIDVLAPTATSGETASASWIVNDPVHIKTGAGDLISVKITPQDGWSFVFADPKLNDTGSAQTFGSAGTSIPGLHDLFHWDVTASTQTPGQVQVSFFSNPALGLNDASVASDIRSRYTFDSATQDYTFNNTGFALAATFEVPNGVSSVDVRTSLGSKLNASAAAVPEASTLTISGVCILSLLVGLRLRCKQPALGGVRS